MWEYSIKKNPACLLGFVLASTPTLLFASGIPEPSLVLYGVVRAGEVGNQIRLTAGTLTWTFAPAEGGDLIVVTASLQNINDQFSYVLEVPCETRVPGMPLSENVLELTDPPSAYDRSRVTIDGQEFFFTDPGLETLELGSTDRGVYQRVDLQSGDVIMSYEDWSLSWFEEIIDPEGDFDGDGLSNYGEYRAGTNPKSDQSSLTFVSIEKEEGQAGVTVQWSSVPGKTYLIQRSADLTSGFETIDNLTATSEISSYHDSSAEGEGPYFYRFYRLQISP